MSKFEVIFSYLAVLVAVVIGRRLWTQSNEGKIAVVVVVIAVLLLTAVMNLWEWWNWNESMVEK